MTLNRLINTLIPGIITVILFSCKPVDIILHGEIMGRVTEASTGDPVEEASITLKQSADTVNTGSNGNYLLKNLIPGDYDIQVKKSGYLPDEKHVPLGLAETREVDFLLNESPVLEISEYHLDFGLDSTELSFTLRNTGTGKLKYNLFASKEWITVQPSSGELTKEIDIITVIITKTDLSLNKDTATIKVNASGNASGIQEVIPINPIHVYLNGVMDQDKNYYSVVTIGSQTWMAENLKVGTHIIGTIDQANNGIIENYRYQDSESNFKTYGGLYQWDEMMQYMPSDNGIIGTTKGICPVGWHIPTRSEWGILITFLRGDSVAGGKLKSTGFTYWKEPNKDATNEFGFSGLPAGGRDEWENGKFGGLGEGTLWWSSEENERAKDLGESVSLRYDVASIDAAIPPKLSGCSVRCVKNLP